MSDSKQKPIHVRVRVTPEKHERFKIACVRLKTSMDAVLNELLDKWLEENDPQK